jgi:hypothetical protein
VTVDSVCRASVSALQSTVIHVSVKVADSYTVRRQRRGSLGGLVTASRLPADGNLQVADSLLSSCATWAYIASGAKSISPGQATAPESI